MASHSNGPAPDLASILQRLRQFSEGQHAANASATSQNEAIVSARAQEPQISNAGNINPVPAHLRSAEQPLLDRTGSVVARIIPTHKPPHRSTTPPIDPATITEWVPGLRCVNRMAEMNPQFKISLRKMMAEQRQQEKNWWKGREALIERQSSRAAGAQNVKDILKSIGGAISAAPAEQDPVKLQAELDAYDMKVYRAQQDMHKALTSELKTLGVPFFGMRVDYLVKLREAELLDLQKKMLTYLEEMYGL